MCIGSLWTEVTQSTENEKSPAGVNLQGFSVRLTPPSSGAFHQAGWA
jgi:hypothetical protein